MTGKVLLCGNDNRCARHDRALHGYPCWACAEEYWYAHPRARVALRSGKNDNGVTLRQVTNEENMLHEATRADPGFLHMTATSRTEAGRPPWLVVCRPECGWSSWGHPTRGSASATGDEHLQAVTRG